MAGWLVGINDKSISNRTDMTKSEIRKGYEAKIEDIQQKTSVCKARGRVLLFAQLVAFAMVVVSGIAYTLWHAGMVCGIAALVSVAGYLLARHADGDNSEKAAQLRALLKAYRHELDYLDGNFTVFRDGNQYIDPHHEYSFDIDIFGSQSLFNRINRTITTGGSDRLAHDLCHIGGKTAVKIAEERCAIDELAKAVDLRMRFIALSASGMIDTDKMKEAFAAAGNMVSPRFATSPLTRPVGVSSVAVMLLMVCFSAFGPLPSSVPTLWGLLQLVVCMWLCGRHVHNANNIAAMIERQAKAYLKIMELIASHDFSAEANRRVVRVLAQSDGNALLAMNELNSIVNAIDRRGHALYMVLANIFFVNDLWLVMRFARWKRKYQSLSDGWIETVSMFDSRVSMATFRYNEPQGIDATIVSDFSVVYEAKGLFHPFIGDKAVANDFHIADGNYYIITGANMAGKSTFLRAIGINYILALCGMPVFATEFNVSLFSLFSSMRTSDDLAHGISYFNAELLRLKQLIDACHTNSRTLIILDEILKGTNSADKLNGSRMFLEAVATMPVTGIIATHDLELSKMADKYPMRFHNYCFEIELANNVTYTYKIKPGVARNQNATFLLRQILK